MPPPRSGRVRVVARPPEADQAAPVVDDERDLLEAFVDADPLERLDVALPRRPAVGSESPKPGRSGATAYRPRPRARPARPATCAMTPDIRGRAATAGFPGSPALLRAGTAHLQWKDYEDRHPSRVRRGARPCTCGNEFTTRSTQAEIHVEICSNCHPFYTGKQKLVDTGGRVERFQRRAAKRSAPRPSLGARPPRLDDSDHETRLPDGALMAQQDAPVGGQAVLEGVMMRGVSTWAVAVRKPPPEQIAPQGDGASRPRRPRSARSRSDLRRSSRGRKRHRVLRWPVIRGVVALVESLEDRLQGARHLRQRPAARGRGADLGRHVGRHGRRRASRSRSACSSSSRSGSPACIKDKLGSACCSGWSRASCAPRSSSATCGCSRACATCGACSSTTAPSTR